MYLNFTFVTLHRHNKTPCKLHDLEIKKEKFNEILPSEWSVRGDWGGGGVSWKGMLSWVPSSVSAHVAVMGSRKVIHQGSVCYLRICTKLLLRLKEHFLSRNVESIFFCWGTS